MDDQLSCECQRDDWMIGLVLRASLGGEECSPPQRMGGESECDSPPYRARGCQQFMAAQIFWPYIKALTAQPGAHATVLPCYSVSLCRTGWLWQRTWLCGGLVDKGIGIAVGWGTERGRELTEGHEHRCS